MESPQSPKSPISTSLKAILESLCPKNQFEAPSCNEIRKKLTLILQETKAGREICELKRKFDIERSSSIVFRKQPSTSSSSPSQNEIFQVHPEISSAVFVLIEGRFCLYESSSTSQIHHPAFECLEGCHDLNDFRTRDLIRLSHEISLLEFPGPPNGVLVVIAPFLGNILKRHFLPDKSNRSELIYNLNSGVQGACLPNRNWANKTVFQVKLQRLLQNIVETLNSLAVQDIVTTRCGISKVMPLIQPVSKSSNTFEERKSFEISDEARALLKLLPGPFRDISIFGVLRGGKSFFLTLVLRHLIGHFRSNPNSSSLHKAFNDEMGRIAFETSDSHNSCTQGAMLCAIPNPLDGGTVLLIDSEGMFAIERDKKYDSQLFSIIFSLSQTLLFNHPDGVLNNSETLESLELSVAIAKLNAPKGGDADGSEEIGKSADNNKKGKTLLLLCRNSTHGHEDQDEVCRMKFKESTFKPSSIRGGSENNNLSEAFFGDTFSLVDIVQLATPRETDYLKKDLVDQNYFQFHPHFRGPFERCLRLINFRLLPSSPPLQICGKTVENGLQLLGILDHMLAAVNGGREIPSLDSSAKMVQYNAQLNAQRDIFDHFLVVSSELQLPVIENELNDLYLRLLNDAKIQFTKSVILVVSKADFDEALLCLGRSFRFQFEEKKIQNAMSSKALSEIVLRESFSTFLRLEKSKFGNNLMPSYIFNTERDAGCVNRNVNAEFQNLALSFLNESIQIKLKPRVSNYIIEQVLEVFIIETLEPHAGIIHSQWCEAVKYHNKLLEERAALNRLEEQFRVNQRAQEELQNRLIQSNSQLQADIETTAAARERLEQEKAEIERAGAAYAESQRNALIEAQRLHNAQVQASNAQDASNKRRIEELYAEQERLRAVANNALSQAKQANDRANKSSSCFLSNAKVLMSDGREKEIKDIVTGDLLIGLNGQIVKVIFNDVSLLGSRSLIGLNGRTPRMTEDHPVFSATTDNYSRVNLENESLLFGNVEMAKSSRHWPNASSFINGSSNFFSVRKNSEDGLIYQQSECLLSINRLGSTVLPPDTLVYDIITDEPGYVVDGVLVRSDFPPIISYPQASLIIERLATLGVHHSDLKDMVVDPKKMDTSPKPKIFDSIARELEEALQVFIARQQSEKQNRQSLKSSSCNLRSSKELFSMETTGLLSRSSWLAILNSQYKVFSSHITTDPKLAWLASRLWSCVLPLLQRMLLDSVKDRDDDDIANISVDSFFAIEEIVINVARKAWCIGNKDDKMEICNFMQMFPIADFSASPDSPSIFYENITKFKKAVGSTVIGEVISFLGDKQSGKNSLIIKRAETLGYNVSKLLQSENKNSNHLLLFWGFRINEKSVTLVDIFLKSPGLDAKYNVDRNLFPLALLCSSFVAFLTRSSPVPHRSIQKKLHLAANFVFEFLKEQASEVIVEEEPIDDFPKFLFFAPNLSSKDKEEEVKVEEEIEESMVFEDNPVFKDLRKLLTLPCLALVHVNSSITKIGESAKGLMEVMYESPSFCEDKKRSRDLTLDALSFFPEVFVTQFRPKYPPGPWPLDEKDPTIEFKEDLQSLFAKMDSHCADGFRLSNGQRMIGSVWIDLVLALLTNVVPATLNYNCGQSPQDALLDSISLGDGIIFEKDEIGNISTSASRAILREFKGLVEVEVKKVYSFFEAAPVWTSEMVESKIKLFHKRQVAWLVDKMCPLKIGSYESFNQLSANTQSNGVDFLNKIVQNLRAHLRVIEEDRAKSFLRSHWESMIPILIENIRANHSNELEERKNSINPQILVQEMLERIRTSFQKGFSFLSDSSPNHDAIFAQFLLHVSSQSISLASTFEWTGKAATEKDKLARIELQLQFQQLQGKLDDLNLKFMEQCAEVQQHLNCINEHRQNVENMNVYFSMIFIQQREHLEAQKSKLERGLEARNKAISMFLDGDTQQKLARAIDEDRRSGSVSNIKAFVEMVTFSIREHSDNPELVDYIKDLVNMYQGKLEIERNLNEVATVQNNVLSYLFQIETVCTRLNEEVNKIMEAKKNGPMQILVGVCLGLAGGCLLGPFTIFGGALLSAGVTGTMIGIQGGSAWDDYFKNLGIAAASGAIGGSCGQFVSESLAFWASSNGFAATLVSNVASGMTASGVTTMTSNFCHEKPIVEGLGKSLIAGGVGGAFLSGSKWLAETKVMQNFASALEKDIGIIGKYIKDIGGTVLPDCASAVAIASVTGEDLKSALKGAIIASSLGLTFKSVGKSFSTVVKKDNESLDQKKTEFTETGNEDFEINPKMEQTSTSFTDLNEAENGSYETNTNIEQKKTGLIFSVNAIDSSDGVDQLNSYFKENVFLNASVHDPLAAIGMPDAIGGDKCSLAAVGVYAGKGLLEIGKNNEIRGVLKDVGGRMVSEATIIRPNVGLRQLGGHLFELHNEATVRVNAIKVGVSGVEVKTTASIKGQATNQVADLLVSDSKTGKKITDVQCKSGSTAKSAVKKAIDKAAKNGTALADQFVVPSDFIKNGETSVIVGKGGEVIEMTDTMKIKGTNGKVASSNPISQIEIDKITNQARSGKNPLTKTKKSPAFLKTSGKYLKYAGKVVFLAGAAYSVTDNAIEVYKGEKSVGKALVCVALDVSGIQLAIDATKLAIDAIKAQ